MSTKISFSEECRHNRNNLGNDYIGQRVQGNCQCRGIKGNHTIINTCIILVI